MEPDAPPPGLVRGRRWKLVAALVVALVGIAAVIVHTPFVRARALTRVLSSLEAAGVRVEAERLSYNLLALRAHLDRVTLSAPSSTTPFLSADRLSVDVPWSAVWGRLAVESIDIERPRVVVVRDLAGTTNLPSVETSGGAGPPGPITIGRLSIRGASIRVADAVTATTVVAPDVTLDMRRDGANPLAGRLTAHESVSIEYRDRRTSITTLAGDLAFDGTVLSIRTLDVAAPELSLNVNGEFAVLTANPAATLRSTATVRLDRLAPWFGLDEPGVGDLLVEGRATVTPSMAEVEALRISVAGGSIMGEGGIAFEDNGTSAVSATWRDLALGPIARAVPAIPVRVASLASGTLAMEWTGFDPLTARGRVNATLRVPAAPGRALPILGRADLELDRRQWTLVLDDRVPGIAGVTARASGQLGVAIAETTLAGQARIEIPNIPGALGRLAAAGYPLLDATLVERVGGTAHLDVDLAGTFGAPRATVALDAADVWADAADASRMRANLEVTSDRLVVNTLAVNVGPNAATGQGTMRFESGALTGVLTGDLPDIGLLAGVVPERWRPAGRARFDTTIGGTVRAPLLGVELTAEDLTAAGQTASTLRARASLARSVVTVDELTLDQPEGRLVLTGRYDLDEKRYVATVVVSNWSVTPIAPDLPIRATFDARLEGEGTVASPEVEGLLSFSRFEWDGRQIGNAEARVAVRDKVATVRTEIPALSAGIDAALALADRTFMAEIVVAGADLSTLVRPSGPAGPPPDPGAPAALPFDLSGTVRLHATAAGPVDDLQAATATLELDLANTKIEGLDVRLQQPARLQYTARQIAVDDLAMEVGTSVVTANGRLGRGAAPGEDLRVAVHGSLADVLPFIRMMPAASDVTVAGALDVTAVATGPIDTPAVTAALSVTSGSFSLRDLPAVEAIGIEATYASGVISISDVRAAWEGAEVTASGEVPVAVFGDAVPAAYLATLPPSSGPARASIKVTGFTESALASFLDNETVAQLAGEVDLTATVEADALDAARVTADVTFDRATVELARVPLSQTAPTHLRLANGRLGVVVWNWAGAGNRLSVTGGIDVAGDTPALDLDLAGSLDLRMIGAFVPGVAFSGQAAIDLSATGPTGNPNVDGKVTVVSGDIVMRDPKVAITDLNGALVLADGRMTLDNVTGGANGGTIEAGGTMMYEGFAPTGGSLWIRGRGLALAVPEDLRTEIDADLTLSKGDRAPSLEGQIAIVRGSYREPISLAQYLFADPEQPSASARAEPGALDAVELDIAIVSSDDIVIDNNYGRFGVGSNLRVAGTIGQPAVSGRLTVQEGGQVFLGGRTYEVTRGIVDFTSPVGIEPTLDLALDTRVGSYDVTLGVSGTLDTLEVSPRSAGLGETDVVSLLLTGQLADESAADARQIARDQLLMLLSGEALAFAGRAVGLDAVQVGQGLGGAASDFDLLASETDPTARLTVTKNLSRQLQVVYSQSLQENGDITWIASYKPTRTIELRGSTSDDDSFSYEFRQRLTFGGGTVPGSGQTGGLSEPPRIEGVTWVEVPDDEVAELSGRLRQTSGDEFDFYDWQRDQDDLVSWYRERGFLEARVTARRRDPTAGSAANAVVLEYRVERGPATKLTINGPALPTNVVDRMMEAWADAVFDGFLVEDLASIGREALIGEGYLNATVMVSVAPPAAEGVKEIVVDVDRGTLYERREIAISGNASVPADALLAGVDAQTILVDAWIGASLLEAALEREYQARGYLTADVVPGAPAFTGSSATLPVRVDEGPLFQIGNVDVQGVSARPRNAVQTTFGLETGMEYRPALLEPARRGVEQEYRSLGYNDARASVTPVIDRAAARVNVTLAVVEGNQAMLSGVDVTGADVTARSTIEGALDLPVGSPVSLDRVYRGQKGLYDTGVFQQADVTLAPVAQEAAAAPPGIQFVRAVVNVRELPRYQFRYGFRLTDEVGPVEATRQLRPAFVADLLRKNLFGRAISTGVAGQIEKDRNLLRGLVSLPRLFALPVVTNLFVSTSREVFPPVTEFDTTLVERVTEFTAEQRFRPARNMGVSYGYDFEHKRTFDPEPDPDSVLPPLDLVAKVARLTATYAWDTRDDPSDAHRGWFHSSGLEYGTEALGSDLQFIKYLAQQSYFFGTFRERVVLASAFRLGLGRPFEGQRLDQKFLAGGGTSVRGFAEDSLGEVDFFGPVGGDALLVLNQEVRFPIVWWFRGVAFIDAGNVYPTPSDLSFRDLEVGTGIGLRIHSPFALLRLDLGIPVTRRDEKPPSRWYFGIGHVF